MPRPKTPRDRERARQQQAELQRERYERLARRRRRTIAAVAIVILLAMLAGLAGTLGLDAPEQAAPTPTAPEQLPTGPTTVPLPARGADLPLAPPGAAITGPTPCPADDGSSPRTTTFAEPPPMCIDTSRFYQAVLVTSKGDLTIQLNPAQAPGAVNNFVVLSRYHYYDGQPVTTVIPRESIVFGGRFDNPEGVVSPGYSIPDEYPPQGQIFTPGSIAMIPRAGQPDSIGSAFLIATYEMSAGLPQTLTQFGIMLDGASVLAAIDRLATQAGPPAEVVTIEDVRITPSVPLN